MENHQWKHCFKEIIPFTFEKIPQLQACFMKMVYWDYEEKGHLHKGSWNKKRNWG